MPERPAAAVVPLAARTRTWEWQPPDRSRCPGSCGCTSSIPTRHIGRRRRSTRSTPRNPYAGEVAATDAALAPLVDDVPRVGRPTLVVVTGDHGEALGDHGEATHGVSRTSRRCGCR